jgi:hypothetical protein
MCLDLTEIILKVFISYKYKHRLIIKYIKFLSLNCGYFTIVCLLVLMSKDYSLVSYIVYRAFHNVLRDYKRL